MATTVTLKPNAIDISGSTSGTTTLQATAVAGTTTITLPAATDTLVGKATTDTLTNKTLTSPTITGGALNGTLGATTPSTVAATTISASSTATFAAGAVGTPSITTTGDTNTGIFFPAADTIAFSEGGVESMRIDSSGRLLVGRTTDNTAFGGNLQVEGASGAFASIVRYSSSAGGAPALYLARSKSATIGTNTIVASADTLGSIVFSGANGTGYSDAAYIQCAVDGTPGASADMPGRLVFATSADGSATPTERMRIDSSGNLLVGVTSATSGGGVLQVSNGITFPATQSASSNANTLDDYEEGTWTPTQGGGLTVVGAFASSGTYTKIGRQVSVIGTMTGATSIAFTTGGAILTGGLPFNLATYGGGQAFNNALSAGMIITGDGGSSIYGAGTIAANARISFQFTYFV